MHVWRRNARLVKAALMQYLPYIDIWPGRRQDPGRVALRRRAACELATLLLSRFARKLICLGRRAVATPTEYGNVPSRRQARLVSVAMPIPERNIPCRCSFATTTSIRPSES